MLIANGYTGDLGVCYTYVQWIPLTTWLTDWLLVDMDMTTTNQTPKLEEIFASLRHTDIKDARRIIWRLGRTTRTLHTRKKYSLQLKVEPGSILQLGLMQAKKGTWIMLVWGESLGEVKSGSYGVVAGLTADYCRRFDGVGVVRLSPYLPWAGSTDFLGGT